MTDWNLFWQKRTTKERIFNIGGIVFNRAFARQISRHIGAPEKCGPILEVGTGRGVCAIALREMGYQCFAVDSSEVAVRLSTAHGLDALLCDGGRLPFGSQTFEVAFTQGLLEHIPLKDQVRILAETRRVARRTIHSVPAKHGVMDVGERLFNRFGRPWPYPDEKKYDGAEFADLLRITFKDIRLAKFLAVDWIGYCE
jgi:ubiquinone/menaquinone biosynthesis C-methylase UbiE